MADRSAIEWTEASWNPVTGCTEVSPGCDHCYARTLAERFRGTPGHPFEQGFDVRLWPDRLDLPARWRRPRLVFVNSMSDLFHDRVPDEFVAEVFARMWRAPGHVFQVLTKRHGRMRSLLPRIEADLRGRERNPALVECPTPLVWPLPNVWLGVSVEDQERAELRVPALLDTPAAVRWVSAEPLLGRVDLTRLKTRGGVYLDALAGGVVDPAGDAPAGRRKTHVFDGSRGGVGSAAAPACLDWVVAGGESGARHRPVDLDWVRSLRDRCATAGTAFFFKQVGGRSPRAGGRLLDGRTWDQMPGAARRPASRPGAEPARSSRPGELDPVVTAAVRDNCVLAGPELAALAGRHPAAGAPGASCPGCGFVYRAGARSCPSAVFAVSGLRAALAVVPVATVMRRCRRCTALVKVQAGVGGRGGVLCDSCQDQAGLFAAGVG